MVVDRMVEAGVAPTLLLVVPCAGLPSQDMMAASIGDAPKLLDVDVDQLARFTLLLADRFVLADGEPGGLIKWASNGIRYRSSTRPTVDRRIPR